MDFENSGNGGFPFNELPLGFGMALAMNERAMQGYAQLTESEKENIIMRCRDASSKDEMQKIVDSLVPDGNVNALFEGPESKTGMNGAAAVADLRVLQENENGNGGMV